MRVSVYKTEKITAYSHNLFDLLDSTLPALPDNCVIAVATKIISLCEGRVVPIENITKDDLVKQEAEWYSPAAGQYGLRFTITRGVFTPTAGIDESNANGQYILWPKDLQASTNAIREHLVRKHGKRHIGVIITDSAIRPLQWGTTGIALAYSGFEPLKDYRGKPDVFGRKLEYHTANVANGLAATATTMMGEGDEQTPIALVEDLPFIAFQQRNPTEEELASLYINREDDMYWPFLKNTEWQKGAAG